MFYQCSDYAMLIFDKLKPTQCLEMKMSTTFTVTIWEYQMSGRCKKHRGVGRGEADPNLENLRDFHSH